MTTLSLPALRALAEEASKTPAGYYANGRASFPPHPEDRPATPYYRLTLDPGTVLALLERLRLAEAVVEAARQLSGSLHPGIPSIHVQQSNLALTAALDAIPKGNP